jgi:hypothetical protein
LSDNSPSLQPLERETFEQPIARRIDAMLARLNAYDFIAALAFAESVRLDMPEHELAAVCGKEALSVLASFLDRPARIARTDTAGLADDAFTLLLALEEATPASLLPVDGRARVATLCALHDLVRLAYFETRENTFVEALVTSDDSRERIDERAHAAAVAELDSALAQHSTERFGIGRCDEIDFASLWRQPELEGAKEIFPLAVGAAADAARRENCLKLYAHDAFPERFVLLTARPAITERGTQVVYVVIAPQ